MIKEFDKLVISDDFRKIFDDERINEIQEQKYFSFSSFWKPGHKEYVKLNGFKYDIIEIICSDVTFDPETNEIILTTFDCYDCGETDHTVTLSNSEQMELGLEISNNLNDGNDIEVYVVLRKLS